MEDKKYVCTECGGISDEPGTCQTEGCAKNGQPLEEQVVGGEAPAEEAPGEEPKA